MPSPTNLVRTTQHHPATDIQSIRELLRGYGSTVSLLKEMVQNAIDAHAENLYITLISGNSRALHSLFHGDALCIVNDGPFSPANLNAIFRMHAGTKPHENHSIGRFGLGIKSVFFFCEAFFVYAKPDPSFGWKEQENYPFAFYNPASGLRYKDWDKDVDAHQLDIEKRISECVDSPGVFDKHWLALWLPLRSAAHKFNRDQFINPYCPAEDLSFFTQLKGQLEDLRPSLFYTRKLRAIRLVDQRNNNEPIVTWERKETTTQLLIEQTKGDVPNEFDILTEVTLNDSETHPMRIIGWSDLLPKNEVDHLRGENWPKSTTVDPHGNEVTQDIKAIPHYAVALAHRPADRGALKIKWSVFLPVGDQPTGEKLVELPPSLGEIVVTLHGYFFLDATRRRIEKLDDGLVGESVESKWNRVVGLEGTLAALPIAVAEFAKRITLSNEQCESLAKGLRKTWIWQKFKSAICSKNRWLPRLLVSGECWQIVPKGETIWTIPPVSHASQFSTLLDKVPGLVSLLRSKFVVQLYGTESLEVSGLGYQEGRCISQDDIEALVRSVDWSDQVPQFVVVWINEVLKQINLTSTSLISLLFELPLIRVQSLKTQRFDMLSLRESLKRENDGRLFVKSQGRNSALLSVLFKALPSLDLCEYEDFSLPHWASQLSSPMLSIARVPQIVLKTQLLGPIEDREALLMLLCQSLDSSTELACAARYLLHDSFENRLDGESTLFIGSHDNANLPWTNLTKKFLSQTVFDSMWRVIPERWSQALPPVLLLRLGVRAINAKGCLDELLSGRVDIRRLTFPVGEWSDEDLAEMIHKLSQAGQTQASQTTAILRQLPIHSLLHQVGRVSIANSNGDLDPDFFLDNHQFHQAIPIDLCDVWDSWVQQVKIVARIPLGQNGYFQQSELFRIDNQGFVNELSWPRVVRNCLGSQSPHLFAPLVLRAFGVVGNGAADGNASALKDSNWVPLRNGGVTALSKILHIDGIEEEIADILANHQTDFCSLSSLDQYITEHPGFASMSQYLPKVEVVLSELGDLISDDPKWHLGIKHITGLNDLNEILSQVRQVTNLGIARLICKLLEYHQGSDRVESGIQNKLLPKVSRSFSNFIGHEFRLLEVLRLLTATPTLSAFNAYLKQADIDGKLKDLLPQLRLLSASGEWKDASDLVWPGDNLPRSVQLGSEHAKILASYRMSNIQQPSQTQVPPIADAGFQTLATAPNFDDEAKKLAAYLEPFIQSYGQNLPAALLLAVAGTEQVRTMLQGLIEQTFQGSLDDFRDLVLGDMKREVTESLQRKKFIFRIENQNLIDVETLTGSSIQVELSDSIESLIVGDSRQMSRAFLWVSPGANPLRESCNIVRLRGLPQIPDKLEAIPVFARTIQAILFEAHCNAIKDLCPTAVESGLERVFDTSQTRLRTSQLALLSNARERILYLGIRDKSPFDEIYNQLVDADRLRVSAKDLAERGVKIAEERSKQAKEVENQATKKLEGILKSGDAKVLSILTDALREKLVDFEYGVRSVPNEVFQNADDAASELCFACRQTTKESQEFHLRLDRRMRKMQFFHWGRPINRHQYPGFEDGRKFGFDEDVHKMLSHGYSDKHRRVANSKINATGRFGLGFKSVFFISDKPRVISDTLGFEIHGGFYPVNLATHAVSEIRDSTKSEFGTTSPVTYLELPFREPSELPDSKIDSMIAEFKSIAGMLCLFARMIRTIKIEVDNHTETWSMTGSASIGNLERVALAVIKNGPRSNRYLTFNCPISGDSRLGAIAFQIGANGPEPIRQDLAGVWCTARLEEFASIRIAINGPFKPDAGRQSIAFSSSDENRKVAEQIADGWGYALVELYVSLQQDFRQFSSLCGFQESVTATRFWERFFELLSPIEVVRKWEDVNDASTMFGWIAFSQPHGAVLRLLSERKAIPTGLHGEYGDLVRLGEVEFVIQGILREKPEWFETLTRCVLVRQHFPKGTIISGTSGELVRKLRSAHPNAQSDQKPIKAVKLIDFLDKLAPNKCLSFEAAKQLGQWLLESKPFDQMSIKNRDEHAECESWFRSLQFMTEERGHLPAADLVCGHDVIWERASISEEELLRSKFAPKKVILSRQYCKDGLAAFLRSRTKQSVDATTLAQWVKESTPAMLSCIFTYILSGDAGFQLAKKLTSTWLVGQQSTEAYKKLKQEDQEDLKRIFAEKGQFTIQFTGYVPIPIATVVQTVVSPKDAFSRLTKWWTKECEFYSNDYDSRTYPSPFPGKLLWPNEDGWDEDENREGWLLLFIQASLTSLGFNRIGRDKNFMQFLVDQNWLRVLLNSGSDKEAVIRKIDNYVNHYVQKTEYHFQMRQFLSFLVSGKYLEEFVRSLQFANEDDSQSRFNHVLTPKADSNNQGLDINAPPLADMLGIGYCFLLRELFRKKRLTAKSGFPFAFTPTRRVRRLCEALFGVQNLPWRQSSQAIFENLKLLGGDPTFQLCFDLPLELLATDQQLRKVVLGTDLALEVDANEGLDEYVY
jgi:hypothetical protein